MNRPKKDKNLVVHSAEKYPYWLSFIITPPQGEGHSLRPLAVYEFVSLIVIRFHLFKNAQL